MHHADFRREAKAVMAKAASALFYDTAVWCLEWMCGTWYGCVGVRVCDLGWDERCDGLRKQVKNF